MDSTFTMTSLSKGYRALIIGSSGALGAAFCECLNEDPRCSFVRAVGRTSVPGFDLENPLSISSAAAELAVEAPYELIVHAAGILHRGEIKPERSYSEIDLNALHTVFQVNTFGPAMVLRYFLPLLSANGAMAMLSAKVGSISDNRLGGWYTYRSSKAALNMLIKTAAIELARTKPKSRLLSLHPGTVISALSQPFRGSYAARPANATAGELLSLIDRLDPSDSGRFFAYNGETIPW